MPVNLVIKSATQTVEDFDLDCELSWTIGRVKDQIAELYPSNPKKENQKLIYGGKLLPDHLSLKSILNHSQERHIVHLVCPSPAKTPNTNESKEATPSQSFPVPPANPTFSPMSQPILNPSLSGMPAVNVTPFGAGDGFQQYLAMQQMYAQFMTQYLSQYNGGVPPVIPYGPAMSAPPGPIPQVPTPRRNPVPRQRPADEEVRDFLDYMYIFSRAVLLFAVLYYYSSLQRVIVVVSMFIFISLYVKLNRRNQEQQRQANERQRNEVPVTQPAPAADIQVSARDERVPETTTPNTDASLSQQTEGRSFTSMVSVTVNLISAFFSSLIPADPVPVNVN